MKTAPELNILPKAQQAFWARLGGLPEYFVLYGGTALALQLGHRESVDFDFFSSRPFTPRRLYEELDVLAEGRITQQEHNTLTVRAVTKEGPVSVSFFGGLRLNHVDRPVLVSPGVRLAGLRDIFGCKCVTVQRRKSLKDMQDICALLRHGVSLAEGLGSARAIYGEQFNLHITLRALGYPPALEGLEAQDRALVTQAVADCSDAPPAEVLSLGYIGQDPPAPLGVCESAAPEPWQ